MFPLPTESAAARQCSGAAAAAREGLGTAREGHTGPTNMRHAPRCMRATLKAPHNEGNPSTQCTDALMPMPMPADHRGQWERLACIAHWVLPVTWLRSAHVFPPFLNISKLIGH